MATVIPMLIIGLNSQGPFKFFALIVTSAIVYSIYGSARGLETFFIYLLPSFISAIVFSNEVFRDSKNKRVGLIFKKGEDFYSYASIKVFMISILVFMLGTVAYYTSMKYMMNIDVVEILKNGLRETLENYRNFLKSADIKGIYNAEVFEEIMNQLGLIILISSFIRAVILAILAYFIAIPLLNKYGEKKLLNTTFDHIVLPGSPVLVLLLTMIVFYVLNSFLPNRDLSAIMSSFLIVMDILFFLEGLSLLVFVAKRWNKVKSNINWLIILLLMLISGIFQGVAVLGVLDNIWNYRMKWYPGFKDFGGKNE